MADKPTNKERLKELGEKIEAGIREVFDSGKYAEYLKVMSRFPTYSVNNQMLIRLQRPNATKVAGYNKWQQFERHVKRGEHGITIIAPTPYKKKIEEQKLDPDTKAPVLDANGKVVMEEKEIEIPTFRPIKVFDYAQTEGKPLPQLAADLFGNVQHYEAFMEALRRTSPVPLTIEPMQDNMDGFFSPTVQRIAIRQGMSEVQTVCACIHEMTHATLHNYEKQRMEAAAGDPSKEPPKPKPHQIEEIEAESTSYMVCQYFGIETGENSFGYVASYCKDRELSELRACLNTINKTAGSMIASIEKHFAEVCKEQGIDLSEQKNEPEQTVPAAEEPAAEEPAAPELDPIDQLASDIDQFAFDFDPYEYRDQVEDREAAVKDLAASLRHGGARGVQDWLQSVLDENEPGEDTAKAAELMQRLDQLAPVQEKLLLLDEAVYLHLQTTEGGYDYTLYDKDTLRQMDGGQLDAPELPLSTAALKICEMHDLGGQSIKYAPLAMIETLQEAAYQQMQEAVAQATAPESTMLPDAPEQALDEYPMPDPMLTLDDLEKCGYRDGDMLPLSKERAMELYERDLTVYAVVDGGSAEMLFDREEFDTQAAGTMYAVSREEWEESPEFDARVQDRLNHQEERERAFLSHEGDCFAIYQVAENDPQRLRFMNIQIAYFAGLRIGEVCGLTWQDIDLKEQCLTIRRSMRYDSVRKKTQIGPTKRKKIRTVDFCDTLAAILREAKKEQMLNSIKYGPLYSQNYYRIVKEKNRTYYEVYSLPRTETPPEDYTQVSFVCLRPDGAYEAPATVSSVCRYSRKKIGDMDDFHFHLLRHTYTTNLLSHGAAPKDVQELLGHSDVSTTMNIYAHATREAKRTSARLLDKVVGTA